MIPPRFALALVIVSTILLGPTVVARAPGTRPVFGLDSPASGPFPSDWFTVPDDTQNTGRRISLPRPDCSIFASDCRDLDVINELDGFNLQPRLSVPFTGPIDVNTVTSETMFLISLGSTVPDRDDMPWGTVIGIDQVIWDTFTKTLHVESDAPLAQHTRFALIVTNRIRDDNGARIKASEAFEQFRATVRDDYKRDLLDALYAARHRGVEEDAIVAASVFTTRSATAVLEKIRDRILAAPVAPADFALGPNGERAVFNVSDVSGISWKQHTRANPVGFTTAAVVVPPGVGSIAFGKYLSPDYQVHPGEYIPAVGTRTGTPAVRRTSNIYFNLYLPAGPKPPGGWPVAIAVHGINGSKQNAGAVALRTRAAHGIASITINAVGNGFGELGTLTVSRTVGGPIELSAGGRGFDQNGDGTIAANEGSAADFPRTIVHWSDAFRQTAVDLMQLVRVIEAGVDLDGDQQPDLDASRITYQGGSWGGGIGTVFLAIEPDLRAGVIVAPGDPVTFGPLGLPSRRVVGTILASRTPSLVNAPGVTALDGLAPLGGPPFFDENQPFRDHAPLEVTLAGGGTRVIQSPVVNTIAGAMPIQELLEHYEWVSQAGSPVAYAPHIRRYPFAGAPAKDVIYVMLKGDQTAPNPTVTAIIRAGDLSDYTVYYRHDLARLDIPGLQPNPHGTDTLPVFNAMQDQAAAFLASDGTVFIPPQPARYFQFPIPLPLPEGLNYR